MELPINWAIVKSPYNWVVIVLMLLIAAFILDIAARHIASANKGENYYA